MDDLSIAMDKKTLEALTGSIRKWEGIVAGTEEDLGSKNCPLCALFYNEEASALHSDCVGCPVFAKTGKRYCVGSPYVEYCKNYGQEQETAAQKELDFLRSLLPPEEIP